MVVCLSGLAVLAARGYSSCSAQEGWREWYDQMVGDIVVSGRVLDENRVPLSRVNISILTSYRADDGYHERDEREYVVVEGDFYIRKEASISFELLFFKEGYYPQTRYFTASNRGEKRFGGITITDLEIVLKKKPTPAPLERIEGVLKSSARGPLAVVKLAPGTRRETLLKKELHGTASVGPHLFLELATEPGGDLTRGPFKIAGGPVVNVAVRPELVSSVAGDGFITYLPTNEYTPYMEVFREMIEAPETGYLPTLQVEPGTGYYIHFFCRLGGLYGKGVTTRPRIDVDGGEEIALTMPLILINPTGSRYVATDE